MKTTLLLSAACLVYFIRDTVMHSDYQWTAIFTGLLIMLYAFWKVIKRYA